MPINPTVARHLNEALAELRAQRGELDAAIKEVEATMARLGGSAPAAEAAADPTKVEVDATIIAPPMKDAVLDYMKQIDRAVTTAQVVDALAPRYGWEPASIRSLMSRMKKDGVLGNPQRGVYNLDPTSTPETSETPDAESGVSDEVATTEAAGGDRDQTPPGPSDSLSF
ncbi:hypothetical protein [Nocardioides caricicola]|uniref:Uncharacterized protein n=1 Tax=Nocardioides caricicola TaxID=634770 RepID=A0ABW0N5R6_9ACTN